MGGWVGSREYCPKKTGMYISGIWMYMAYGIYYCQLGEYILALLGTKSTFSHSFSFLNHLNHPQRHRPQHDSDTALQSLGHGEDEFYVDIQLGDRILNFLTSYTTENIHTIL